MSNREKTQLVDALKQIYPVLELLETLGLARSGVAEKNLDWFYVSSPRLFRYSMGLRAEGDLDPPRCTSGCTNLLH
ncbi:hypothetical protein RCH10_005619 [Variovorax sp. GrIS 2.14]